MVRRIAPILMALAVCASSDFSGLNAFFADLPDCESKVGPQE